MSDRSGRFIVLDGPDGGGKTTQIEKLKSALEQQGRSVLVTREPGGTAIGEKVRDILLDPKNTGMSLRAELFLYMASRAQLVDEVIKPALNEGKIVLSDRFLTASVVYQGIAGGLGADEVMKIGEFCIQDAKPDIIFILDIRVDASVARRKEREADRIEQRDLKFHENMRQGFLTVARADPQNYRIIDADQPEERVFEQIIEAIESVF
ncbi:MAG: dTMP kinase [Planctomycetota bacterium]|nr:dTMP kinase [Planctomycetota bacterium]MDA1142990.1 dTMP kinase [Planctomycetota bacterium]